jgi:hypothetical protein
LPLSFWVSLHWWSRQPWRRVEGSVAASIAVGSEVSMAAGLAGFAEAGSAGEAAHTGADGLAVSIRATTAGAMAAIRMATMGTLTPTAHTPTTVTDRRLVPR